MAGSLSRNFVIGLPTSEAATTSRANTIRIALLRETGPLVCAAMSVLQAGSGTSAFRLRGPSQPQAAITAAATISIASVRTAARTAIRPTVLWMTGANEDIEAFLVELN